MEMHTPLSNEEIERLRQYLAPGRTESRQYWWGWLILALVPMLFLALGQVVLRWLPGHLEACGLAICQAHPTLRHGKFWWPSNAGFDGLCRTAGGVLIFCAYYAGVMTWAAFYHERRARQFALLIARANPDLTFAPFAKSQRAS